MEWNIFQPEDPGINVFINEKFLYRLKDEFEDKNIDIVALKIEIKDNMKTDNILLTNENLKDIHRHKTPEDYEDNENFKKIQNVLNDL